MKKHNTIKVVLITMLVFLLLSWILPAAYYSGQYIDQGRVQMGLFDLFNYPITSFSYFGYIGLFFILVGGFYGILYKIPGYRVFLERIAKTFEGKGKIVLSIIVALIALLVSVCGIQFGIALFIPFIISIILLMGYDKITAALVTIGGIIAGLIGTTYAENNTGVLTASFALNTNFQLGVRFIILLVAVIIVIFNVLMYLGFKKKDKVAKKAEVKEEKVVAKKAPAKKAPAKKTAKNEKVVAKKAPAKKAPAKKAPAKKSKNSNKAALIEEDVIVVPAKVTGKHKIWPFVLTFSLLFVLFVLAFLPWPAFGVDAFEKATTAVKEFTIFKFPIFGKILGSFNAFGNWTMTDLFLPMALTILVLVLIYKVKLDDIFDGFIEGAKKALAPFALVVLLYSILVIVTYHPFQLVIYKAILELSKGFNLATTVIVALLAPIFNSDVAYSFQALAPYYTSIVTKADNYPLAAIILQSMYGLAMLFAPTSLVLMAILSYLKVSYKEWLKTIWKLLLELFIVLLITFIILALI
ncbi:MAG: hypothetical protein IK137_03995 [Bacilli bacterium]|nr:hypothetical protein [Bacilli bacterium]